MKFEESELMEQGRSSSSRLHRNIRERDRRMHMKDLFARLAFLMPPKSSRLSVPELLDHATTYIKHLKERVEEKKRRKAVLRRDETSNGDHVTGGSRLPTINITNVDSTLEVNLISGLNKNFMLHEIIRILEDEAANVISVAHSNVGDRVIYVIKCQAISPRIGMETSRVHERLKELVF